MNQIEKKFSTGGISATVWRNESKIEDKEGEYWTISVDRRYKDKEGNWKSTNSLRVNDLPKMALVASKAYEYLVLKDDKVEI